MKALPSLKRTHTACMQHTSELPSHCSCEISTHTNRESPLDSRESPLDRPVQLGLHIR